MTRHRPPTRLTAYHASREPIAPGTILVARAQNLLDADIEAALEAARPAHRIARHRAVYAAPSLAALDHVTAGHDYRYRVALTEPVLLDHGWINRIWQIFAAQHDAPSDDQRRRIATLARLYWSGQRAPESPLTPYAPEYLCQSGEIVEALDA